MITCIISTPLELLTLQVLCKHAMIYYGKVIICDILINIVVITVRPSQLAINYEIYIRTYVINTAASQSSALELLFSVHWHSNKKYIYFFVSPSGVNKSENVSLAQHTVSFYGGSTMQTFVRKPQCSYQDWFCAGFLCYISAGMIHHDDSSYESHL